MVKIAVLLLSLITLINRQNSVAGYDRQQFATSNCGFTLELLKTIAKENQNVIISPVSISLLLAILLQGARDNTAAEISHALGLGGDDAKAGYSSLLAELQRAKSNNTIEWGNRAYIRPGFQLDSSFKQNIAQTFGADIEPVNFLDPGTPAYINSWVSNVTRGHIQDLVSPGTLTSQTVMLLVNAIFFKGLWQTPFYKKRTRKAEFRVSPSSRVNVTFMHQAEEFVADQDDVLGAKWVHLTFADDGFSMVFVLPTEDHKLNELLSKLTEKDLKFMLTAGKVKNVRLVIPKFQLSRKLSLAQTLKAMGVKDAFSLQANLRGVSAMQPLYLSDIIHRAAIDVNEDGSTAAAASAGVVNVLSLNWHRDEMTFYANQPFLVFITDRTGLPLFAGKVVNPTVQ